MTISVIIPVHNLGNRVTESLDSVAVQDFDKSEYEILIVLDACNDDSESVVREWRYRHQNIHTNILYSHCRTPGGARNVGLDNAEGEYIIFIDGDDKLINTSAMAILYNAVQGHNAVRVTDHAISGTHTKFSDRLTMWLHFFSREIIGNDRFTNMLLNEDYEFVKRIRSKPEYNEAIVTTPLYYYNYDNRRMVQRIKEVLSASYERRQQGLPPLYISDEFIVKAKEKVEGNMPSGGLSGC